jgi:sarcosine oxidase subunit beta
MDMPREADIVVIGGGISGCGTAYYLAKGGLDVVIVEQRSIASGASGRNGAQLLQMDGRTLNVARVSKRLPFVRADVELLRSLNDELGMDIELQQFGSVDLAANDEESEILINMTEIQKNGGDTIVEYLNRKELLEYCPAISKDIRGGKFTRTDGSVNPIKLAWAYALAAHHRYNAKLLLHNKVEDVIIKGGSALGVKTTRGDIMVNVGVVNCTNAWLIEFTKDIPVFPVQNVTSVTEQVPKVPIITWDGTYKGNYGYGTSQKNGSLVIGSLPFRIPESVEGHFDESVSYEDLERHAGFLTKQFPMLKHVSFIRIWAGVFAMTPDRLPYIGLIPGYRNYYINTGYSNGMAYCPIGAKLISEFILNDGHTSIPLDLVRPDRYLNMKFDILKRYNYTVLEHLLDEWNL